MLAQLAALLAVQLAVFGHRVGRGYKVSMPCVYMKTETLILLILLMI